MGVCQSVHDDLGIRSVQAFAVVVGIQTVLVHKIWNRWPELLPLAAQKLLHEALILIDSAAQDDTSLGLEEHFGGHCVLLPNLPRDERRVDHYHMELAMELSRQLLWLVEVVKDVIWILVEALVELQRKRDHRKF